MKTPRRLVKRAIDGCCLAMVSPLAGLCALESRYGGGDACFTFSAQLCALLPGLPGVFLRRAFYRLTLESCGRSFFIGFGAMFSHRTARVADDVYVGPWAMIGACDLGQGCLIGTRCSIISGGALHSLDAQGRWMATDPSRMQVVHVGEYAWLGEASVVLADIGRSAMVVAGAVVSASVPPSVVVAGNPARFVRQLSPVRDQDHHATA
jgi:virginiamycin A acetyltransferase